jgi:tRNA dimethylallyltransferase
MFQRGVIEEATHILALSPSPSAMKTIGLRELKSFLEGNTTLDEAKELMILRTKQYAKRQRTWFRHQFK